MSNTITLPNLPTRPDNELLKEIIVPLLSLQNIKEKDYGSSWCKQGEYRGIMANIDRKYDRLDNMTNRELEGLAISLPEMEAKILDTISTGNIKDNMVNIEDVIGTIETKLDAIADLGLYCLLYMTWVKKHCPHVFDVWGYRNVPHYDSSLISTEVQK